MFNEFYLGALSAFVFVGVPYVLYQYCYLPWKVVRRDIQALVERVSAAEAASQGVKAEMNLRKALYRGDEELAQAEARRSFRQMMRGLEGDQIG